MTELSKVQKIKALSEFHYYKHIDGRKTHILSILGIAFLIVAYIQDLISIPVLVLGIIYFLQKITERDATKKVLNEQIKNNNRKHYI